MHGGMLYVLSQGDRKTYGLKRIVQKESYGESGKEPAKTLLSEYEEITRTLIRFQCTRIGINIEKGIQRNSGDEGGVVAVGDGLRMADVLEG